MQSLGLILSILDLWKGVPCTFCCWVLGACTGPSNLRGFKLLKAKCVTGTHVTRYAWHVQRCAWQNNFVWHYSPPADWQVRYNFVLPSSWDLGCHHSVGGLNIYVLCIKAGKIIESSVCSPESEHLGIWAPVTMGVPCVFRNSICLFVRDRCASGKQYVSLSHPSSLENLFQGVLWKWYRYFLVFLQFLLWLHALFCPSLLQKILMSFKKMRLFNIISIPYLFRCWGYLLGTSMKFLFQHWYLHFQIGLLDKVRSCLTCLWMVLPHHQGAKLISEEPKW